MGAYLDRLKNLATPTRGHLINQNNPEPEGSLGFLGAVPCVSEKITDPLPDNRRTCTECTELHRGRCRAAARGELSHVARRYEPIADRLHRCLSYRPGPDDTDRRTGRERYPGMARKADRGTERRVAA